MHRFVLAFGLCATTGCAPVLVAPAAIPVTTASYDRTRTSVPVYPKGGAPDRLSEIVAILDFHSEADSEQKGFDELRAHAAAAGADAVINAEFEHGDAGEQSHLSGMAIRWITRDARAYDVIDTIVVETESASSDKGLARFRERARELGADKVIDVKFEHGEEGRPSRLVGTAVRYTK